MKTLDPQAFAESAMEMKEKIKWQETKTSEIRRKKEKTQDRDLWIYLYTAVY